jgi:hypothetical protein
MKKEMAKLHVGKVDPKKVVEDILRGDIPTPSCIFCREVRNGSLLVFNSPSGNFAFCCVCELCIPPNMIESKMDVIEKRVGEIYREGNDTKLDEQMFNDKIVSRIIGEA